MSASLSLTSVPNTPHVLEGSSASFSPMEDQQYKVFLAGKTNQAFFFRRESRTRLLGRSLVPPPAIRTLLV